MRPGGWPAATGRLILLLLAAAGCLVATVPAAGAHAVLEQSSPGEGEVLHRPPAEVSFTFSEPVESGLGAVTVLDPDGAELPLIVAAGPGPETVAIKLGRPLPDGTYTALYRVISADSHPVSGGITFSIERRRDGGAAAANLSAGQSAIGEAGPVVRTGFVAVRWVGYIALALTVGLGFWFWLLGCPGGGPQAGGPSALRRRLRFVLLAAISAGILTSLAALVFQGAVASGGTLRSALDGDLLREVAGSRLGTVMLVRAGLFAALLPFVLGLTAGRRGPGVRLAAMLAAAAGLGLLLTPAASGHAAARDPAWLLVPADFLHVAAMAVWAGGLVGFVWILPVALRPLAPGEKTALLHRTLGRFSPLALAAVAVVALTGGLQAVIGIDRLGALADTAYGRAVTIKVLLLVALIVLGALNRNRVIPGLAHRLADGAGPGPAGRSGSRNLRLEVVLIAVVLAVSAALVGYPPPDTVAGGPVSGTSTGDGERVEYRVDPARTGANAVDFRVLEAGTGRPVRVRGLRVAFDPPGGGTTPIKAAVRRVGPGHFAVPAARLAVPGRWQALVVIRRSRFEESTHSFEVEIR